MYRKAGRGQATLEVAFVFIAVIVAVILMSTYMKRACNAKLKRTAEGLNDVFEDINNP